MTSWTNRTFQRKNIDLGLIKIKQGKIAVIPTDTLYGIVGQALNKKTVQKIYRLRKRNPIKPCIVLVSSLADLAKLSIRISAKQRAVLKQVWPGPVSVVFPCKNPQLNYLHRGTYSLAVRLPANYQLRSFLKKTGPLIAPSANPEGLPPATTIPEAERYFKNSVSIYLDAGSMAGKPSTLIAFFGNSIEVLRKGKITIALKKVLKTRL